MDNVPEAIDTSIWFARLALRCLAIDHVLLDASRERRSETIEEAITITQHLDNARQVSHIIRSQFEPKSDPTFDLTVPEFNLGTEYEHEDAPEEFEVQVRVEHTVKLDRRLRTYELENYSRNERCSQDMHSRHR